MTTTQKQKRSGSRTRSTCPRCTNGKLRRSQRPRRWNWVFKLAGRKSFTCDQCGARVYLKPSKDSETT